jgi:2-haloacid dehalogenase
MIAGRREFLSCMAASGAMPRAIANPASRSRGKISAVAFDGFAVLDGRPVLALVNELYPEKGAALGALWHDRQFEYAWLRSMSKCYSDFNRVNDDALVFAARALGLELTVAKHSRLIAAYLKLQCWPDVPDTLRSLKNAGIRTAFLSNLTAGMLGAGIRNSGLDGLFDYVLSTDRVQAYKPDPCAYQMGLDAFGLKRDQILFVAFAGWDAAGAKSFGYPTFWVNRQNQPREELGGNGADIVRQDLVELPRLIGSAST